MDITPLRKAKPALKLQNLNVNTTDPSTTASPFTSALPKSPVTPKTPSNVHKFDLENIDPFSPNTEQFSSPSNFVEPRKPSSIRKPQKRIRSPNLDGDCSPGML